MPWPWKPKQPHGAPVFAAPQGNSQAVIVSLVANDLPAEVYQAYDVVTLEDQLGEAIAKAAAGEYDGNEFGPEETTLYMYGPDAERLFTAVEAVLRAYPLCKGARVLVRPGGPDTPGRTVVL